MLIYIKVILFLAAVCFLGFLVNLAIYFLCANKTSPKINPMSLPLFFALGAGIYTFVEMFLSISGIKSSIAHFIVLCLFFLLINSIFYLRGRQASFLPLSGLKVNPPFMVIVFAATLLLLLASLLMSMAFPQFDIDLLNHILMKAKIFTTDTYKSSVYFHDDLFANLHSRYPPLAGIFFNLLFLFGCQTLACYQVVNYFIFFLLGISIYQYLQDKIPVWQNISWLFIFFSTRAYISSQFIMDSTDVALSLYFLLTLFLFLETFRERSRYNFVVYVLLLGLGTLVKNEALLFSLVFIFMSLCKHKKIIWRYLWIWLAIALPWVLYRQSLPDPLLSPESILRGANIAESLKHIPAVLATVFSVLLTEWNAAFVLLIAAVIILSRGRYKQEAIAAFIVVAALISAYIILIWLDASRPDADGLYRNGLLRLFSHVYPIAFTCLAIAIGGLFSVSERTS